jgi:hypothetical protein
MMRFGSLHHSVYLQKESRGGKQHQVRQKIEAHNHRRT